MRLKPLIVHALAGPVLILLAGCAAPEAPPAPPVQPAEDASPSLREIVQEGRAAYERGDHAAFLDAYRQAERILPGHPRVLYNIACGSALTGDAGGAFEKLERLAAMGLHYDVAADEDLASLRETERFAGLAGLFQENLRPVGASSVAFTLEDREFLPEGVAWDPVTGDFFVSSIRRGIVVRRDRQGSVTELPTPGGETRYAVLGMTVDPQRRRLWTGAASVPEVLGYTEEMKDRAAVLMFDLGDGSGTDRPRIFPAPGDGRRHLFGDVALHPSGDLYVSDSASPVIFRIREGGDLEPWLETGDRVALQGLAMTPEGDRLFVADYTRGIFSVDLASREITTLTVPDDAVPSGIDGLYLHDGSLVGIQNGVRPQRVVRFRLDGAGRSVTGMETLEAAHDLFGEPTLGVLAGGALVYVANSPWGHFDAGGLKEDAEGVTGPVILRLEL